MVTLGRQVPSATNRFELLVEALSDYAIYMLDDSGHITTWNSGAERLFGPRSWSIGQHFSVLFSPVDRAGGIPQRLLEQAAAAGDHATETWRLRHDGTRFRADATLHTLRERDGRIVGFAEIVRDCTEKVEAARALTDSEHRFRMLVEGVVDYAIYMLDPSGIVTSWNSGAEHLKGYRSTEIIGQHFSKFYSREDRSAGLPARALATAAADGRHESEGWRVRKDGSRFWASTVVTALRNQKGQLEGFAKVTRDITERRAAQEALRESERQFRLLVEGITDYGLYMLDPNGVVTSWNPGAQRIKGYHADEVIGQHFSRFFTERDRAAGLPVQSLREALSQGRFESEGWRVKKDGTMFWTQSVIQPIRDEGGTLLGFAKLTRDITERRNAEVALERAEAQRTHALKMDALGQLTGGVAHDFNNLLMVISGYVPLLKRKLPDDSKLARALEAIDVAAQRGASLTRQLLTFSRRQAVNPVVLRLQDRSDALYAMLAGSVGQAKLVISIEPEIWSVHVDASELELAIVNLVLNARDAMPKGGTIAITAENASLSADTRQDNLAGDFVALHVSDTGPGIAPDVLPKVFDPFFTTKEVGKGSGLGLSQVHGFAHQSGGTVTINTEVGRGTIVTLYLPKAQTEPRPLATGRSAEGSSGGAVLLIEDNPDVLEVTTSMLHELGFEVTAASGVEMAMQLAQSRAFDLIISDIVIPGEIDGVALARALRAQQPNIPILLVTGYSETMRNTDADFPVLRKPFDLAELSRATARLIALSNQKNNSNVVRLSEHRHVDPD
jgi:PAS domain S-box-containing protein